MDHLLLDTSPIVAHLRRKIDLHQALPPDALLFTSMMTVGELEKGIHRVKDPVRERAKCDTVLQPLAILTVDETTARLYGQISAQLEAIGKRIPENDIWIAAFALEYGLELVTGDAHFERVEGLKVRLLSW